MWDSLLQPGLSLACGRRRDTRLWLHDVAQHRLQSDPRTILWVDGDHGFDPYLLAEANFRVGQEADAGANRMLVKRCMTPFQWAHSLTQHLPQKVLEVDAGCILVAPFDRLFSTDELRDWEQEDYVRAAMRHLSTLARRTRIPILLTCDLARWFRTHPMLAQHTQERVHHKWNVHHEPAGFVATRDAPAAPWHDTPLRLGAKPTWRTLEDYLPKPMPIVQLNTAGVAAQPAQGQ